MPRVPKLVKKLQAKYEIKERKAKRIDRIKAFFEPLISFLFLASLIAFGVIVLQDVPHGATVHAHETVTHTPAVSPSPVVPKSVEQEIREVFGKDAAIMLKIAKCESGLRPHAHNKANKNGTEDRGVFQINTITWPNYTKESYDLAFDQTANILVAKLIFDKRGTQPWYSSQHCWSKL